METVQKKSVKIDGSKAKISIIIADFHNELASELLKNTKTELEKNNVKKANIKVIKVPGTMEMPFICKRILEEGKSDAIITLGIVIRGQTNHYDLVINTTYQALMQLQITTANIPIVFGILTCENLKQARERVHKKMMNKGQGFAQTALRMYQLNNKES